MSDATLYLVRHGQSVWNDTRRVAGQLDPPLSPRGEAQAQVLADVLAERTLDAVYASPLTRARQTAAPAAASHGLPVQTRPALAELHFGALQGRWRDERDPEAMRWWKAWKKEGVCPPGAETIESLRRRVVACLTELCAVPRRILVVAHRHTNQVALGYLLGYPLGTATQPAVRSKYLYEITLADPPSIRSACLVGGCRGTWFDAFKS